MPSSRRLPDWLNAYLKFVENSEPPISYHVWTALSTIAAALARKVVLPWGLYDLYPNFYVILVGPPGNRKGTAMKVGKRMLRELGIKLASDCVTRARLIEELEANRIPYGPPEKLIETCSLSIFSEELVVLLGDKNPDMISTLCDLYDCPEVWDYATKNKGVNLLQNVYLNIIGATTPQLLKSRITADAVGGGLTSRVIVVNERQKAKTVALPFLTEEEMKLHEDLLHDLDQIRQLEGRFVFSTTAIKLYADWYEDPRSATAVDDPRFDGYNSRRATHLRKLCMLVSASRSNELVIRSKDFQRSLALLESVEDKMLGAFHGVGTSDQAKLLSDVIEFLMMHGTLTWRQILDRFKYDASSTVLKEVLNTLNDLGVCSCTINPLSSNTYTYMPKKEEGEDD